jgi:hypothetical protein
MVADGLALVSLHLDSPGQRLADLRCSQRGGAAEADPDEVAALVLSDVLFGNWDRARNIKVSVSNRHLRLFRGFDHSHALVGVYRNDPEHSLSDLRSCVPAFLRSCVLIVRTHP